MQRSLCAKIVSCVNNNNKPNIMVRPISTTTSFDVFISHRGIDTRRNVAGILYGHLSGVGLRPFLDSKSMSPGDKLMNQIDTAIKGCKVGIPIFSEGYCKSYYCLYELASMLRSNKCIIPIFCNMNPSNLQIPQYNNNYNINNGRRRRSESCFDQRLHRFAWAIHEAKTTVGLSFDTTNSDWSELLVNVSDAAMKLVKEDETSMYLRKNVILPK